jgi:methylmalonyl-CoA/ethylmalonyl-CoA epimerase
MDIRRITEVGIAVHDLDEAVALFENLFDAEVGELIDVPMYDMRFKMCRVGKVDFEVMAPTAPTGVIADFLTKRGPGLHHIAFAVDDKPATLSTSMIDFAGRRFDDDISFTFSHPASILGILFEFIQYPDDYATP